MSKLISVVQYNQYADRGIKNTFAKLITNGNIILDIVTYNGIYYRSSFLSTMAFLQTRQANKFSIQVTYE